MKTYTDPMAREIYALCRPVQVAARQNMTVCIDEQTSSAVIIHSFLENHPLRKTLTDLVPFSSLQSHTTLLLVW